MFGKRLMSSVVLVVLALFLLLTGGGILALGMLILSLIAFRELTKACGVIDAGQKNNALEGVGYGGIILYYLVVYGIKDPVYWMGMLAVIFLGLMFVYVFSFLNSGRSSHDHIFLRLLCPGFVYVYFSHKKSSQRHLYGLDDFHQFLDLRYLCLSFGNGNRKA